MLEDLYLKDHYDYNFEHFSEDFVLGIYNISYTMLKRFTSDDIIFPLAHKKTIIEYKNEMKTVVNEDNSGDKKEKAELYKLRIFKAEEAHPRKPNNLYVFGQEVQKDACQKLWFGGIPSYYGIPDKIKADNRSSFLANNAKDKLKNIL